MPKRSFFVPVDNWEGEHHSYKQAIEGLHSFTLLNSANNPGSQLDAYNAISKEFQQMIADAIQHHKTLRALGSSWSLSKVAVCEHHLINTKALRIGFSLSASKISSSYTGDRSKLRFLECGASIASINRYLFQDGLSLKTSGSNNGQTLAGVISTGTHGSAFKFGACQEFVVGIHLITGPNKQVYLERASYPVSKPGFAAKLGADFIRDDQVFNAALVSFGAFGIIHGLMIEARDLFALNAHRYVHDYNAGLKSAISNLDFSGLDLPKPASKLHHFEVVLNPNAGTPPQQAIVIAMYETNVPQNYEPPEWHNGAGGPGVGALEIMGELVGLIPSPLTDAVKPILNTQVSEQFSPYQKTGVIKDLFSGEKVRGKNLSCGMGIALSSTLDALNVTLDTYKNFGSILPLLVTIRYVKGTKALLGFTKFDTTCILEIDAVSTTKTRQFLKVLWANLEQANIPFTLHWGKFNNFLTKNKVKKMYGDNVERWKTSRSSLLENTETEKVFSNAFTKKAGLTE